MRPDRAHQQERASVSQDSLRALVRLLARSAAQEFVAASSTTRSIQTEATDAQPPRRRP